MIISIKAVLLKAYQCICIIEQCYDSVIKTYIIIFKNLKNNLFSKKIILHIAVETINNIVGSKILIITLLIYNAYSYIYDNDILMFNIIFQTIIIRKIIAKVIKLNQY